MQDQANENVQPRFIRPEHLSLKVQNVKFEFDVSA